MRCLESGSMQCIMSWHACVSLKRPVDQELLKISKRVCLWDFLSQQHCFYDMLPGFVSGELSIAPWETTVRQRWLQIQKALVNNAALYWNRNWKWEFLLGSLLSLKYVVPWINCTARRFPNLSFAVLFRMNSFHVSQNFDDWYEIERSTERKVEKTAIHSSYS